MTNFSFFTSKKYTDAFDFNVDVLLDSLLEDN